MVGVTCEPTTAIQPAGATATARGMTPGNSSSSPSVGPVQSGSQPSSVEVAVVARLAGIDVAVAAHRRGRPGRAGDGPAAIITGAGRRVGCARSADRGGRRARVGARAAAAVAVAVRTRSRVGRGRGTGPSCGRACIDDNWPTRRRARACLGPAARESSGRSWCCKETPLFGRTKAGTAAPRHRPSVAHTGRARVGGACCARPSAAT